MPRILRTFSCFSLAIAIAAMLAAPALAVPPDIASRAGRYARQRAAEQRNTLREPEVAEEEEIPADAEVVDDVIEPSAKQPVGTGTRGNVRRATLEEELPAAPRRTYSRNMPQQAMTGYRNQLPPNQFVPAHERMYPAQQRMGRQQFIHQPMNMQEMPEGQEEIPMPMGRRVMGNRPADGRMMGEEIIEENGAVYDDYYGGQGYGPNGYGPYGRSWGDNCNPCCFQLPRLCYFEAFAGAHGFTGPLNRGTGSFGFQEGFNAGMPCICGLTMQVGINATQSNFQGAPFTTDDRTQLFTTLGAFRRVDLGLQAGLVIDYLHDEWDYNVDLTQLRGELGWLTPCGNELGFWFTIGLDKTNSPGQTAVFGNGSATFTPGTLNVEPVDIYAFYYRKQFACGGQGRLFAGFTDDSRGLLGGNIRLPINPCWQFTTDFIYVVADDNSQFKFNNESWNVSFNLVWTPCAQGRGGCQNYCRPLLDVANNGSFLTRLR